jgi:hypothetical protein
MLKGAVCKAALANPRPGVRANSAFADGGFDLYASEAIEDKVVGMLVAPLDLCTGVLPLTQLGLHFWFHHYTHVKADASNLLALAQAVSFVKGRVLDPLAGLDAFLPAWGTALGEEGDIPPTDTMHSS